MFHLKREGEEVKDSNLQKGVLYVWWLSPFKEVKPACVFFSINTV